MTHPNFIGLFKISTADSAQPKKSFNSHEMQWGGVWVQDYQKVSHFQILWSGKSIIPNEARFLIEECYLK